MIIRVYMRYEDGKSDFLTDCGEPIGAIRVIPREFFFPSFSSSSLSTVTTFVEVSICVHYVIEMYAHTIYVKNVNKK